MPTIIDPAPSGSRPLAVRLNQVLRLVADSASDWYKNLNGTGFVKFASNVAATTLQAPSSLTNRFTFDRLDLAVVTPGGAAPTTATVLVNVVEGPVAVRHATTAIRNEARQDPPLHPDMLESDDPPLGLPLAMPGANRDGFGTVLEERVYEASGPANLVSLYGPGLFLESSGNLGSRVPIGRVKGLGPFPTVAAYHHGAFYFNWDFGKSRTLSLTRFAKEDTATPPNVAIVRGDGRRNTYRYFNSVGGVTYYTPASALRNTLLKSGGFFAETTTSGTYYVYNVSGALAGKLDRIRDRYNNTVYYTYDTNNKLQKITGLTGASGLVPYLRYDASGRCSALVLQDLATPANDRTTYFEYDANNNLIKLTGPELCTTYFQYGSGSPTIEFLTSATDSLNRTWTVGYDGNSRVNKVVDAQSPPGTAYFGYDTSTPITTWVDRAGRSTYFDYNAHGSPTFVRNDATATDYFRYDGDGNLTSTQNRLVKNWYFQYDGNANRISVVDPLLAKSYFAYDSQYRLVSFTDPLLHKTYLVYDTSRNRTIQIDPIFKSTYFAYQSSGLLNYKKDRRLAFTYFTFDGKANLTAITDHLGATTYFNYNSAGDRTQTIDALSRTSNFAFDKRGRLTESNDPLNDTRYFAYDAACNVVAEVDPRNTPTYHTYDGNYNRTQTAVAMGGGAYLFTYFTYDAEDRLASRKDARLNSTSWTYDKLGRRQNQTDPFANVRYWAYDAAHETSFTLDENGQPSYYDYDATGRLAHSVDAQLNSEYYGYDVCGNRVKVTDKRGNSTTFTYDARDQVQNTTNAIGAITYNAYDAEQNRIMTLDPLFKPAYFNYDAVSQLTSTRDALGNYAYFEYDLARQQTRRLEPPLNGVSTLAATYYTYDLAGRRQTVKDAYLNQSYMAYDRSGNVILSTTPRYATTPTAFQYFNYDAANRQLETIDSGQLRTYHVYDLVGNRVAVFEEQGFGRQPWGTSPYGGERVARYFEFDALNRMSNALGASSLYSQNVSLTYTGYDKASNRVQMRLENPKGGTDVRYSYFEYDRLNRMVKSFDPNATTSGGAGGMTYFGYDENSNRITVVDQEGRPTYLTYDAINRQQNQRNAFLDTAYMVYDARNSVTRRIDPVGRAVYYDFDELSRMIRQSNALGQVSYFGYDARSSRVLSQNPRGFSSYFTYDLLGRLTHQKDALNGVRYFAYDEVGNKTLEVDERSGWTYFAYDQANRTRMVMDQGDVNGVRGQTYFGWDAVGLMRMKTDADGRLTSFGYFGYDASRRPTTETHDTDPWLYFTYDSVGNLTQTKDETGTFGQTFDALNRIVTKQTFSDTVYYQYDKSSMKTQVAQPAGGGTFIGSYYVYDAASRLFYVAPFAGPGGNIRPAYYSYDAAGLMTRKILFGNNVMTYFVYDSASRLQQMANLDSAAATITYLGYARDANGNNTSTAREGGMTIYYAYDALDRLTQESWKSSGGATIYGFYYNYDAASNRYFQYDYRGTPVTTYWTYDARNVLTKEDTVT